MSWQEDVHLVPSRNRALLASLIGRSVDRLLHYFDEPPEELLRGYAYAARGVKQQELFRVGGGPVVIGLDDGRELCIAYSEDLISVTVEPAEEAGLDDPDWAGPIEATDDRFAEPRFASALGKVITGIRVLQLDMPNGMPTEIPTESGKRMLSPKAVDRPREIALILELDEATPLIFSATLFDVPNNFAVTTDLNGVEMPLKELMRIRADA